MCSGPKKKKNDGKINTERDAQNILDWTFIKLSNHLLRAGFTISMFGSFFFFDARLGKICLHFLHQRISVQ